MHGHDGLFQSLEMVRSETDLAAFLQEVTRRFGFDCFLIATIPPASAEQLEPHIALSDRSSCFFKGYDALGLLKNSPIFAQLRRTTVPITWTMDGARNGRPPNELPPAREFFAKFGITIGVFFPVHSADGTRATIGFDGDRPQMSTSELSQLGLIVTHAYDVFTGLRNAGRTQRQSLTVREMEVLTWAANGKTSSEIAAILSLSDHTINTYMNTAMRKLDCVNRTQLVAKALRLHLIS